MRHVHHAKRQRGSGTVEAAAAVAEAEEERELWTGSPDFVVEGMASRTTRYTVTTERIRVETGMIGKKTEQLELFR